MNDYYVHGKPLEIGRTPQLLVDDCIVEDRWKLTRCVGTVVKHPANPVLVKDKPWEGDSVHGMNPPMVLFDESRGKFRMWYCCFDQQNYCTHEGPGYFVAYAESDDGVHWTKPAMTDFPFKGYDATNVVHLGRNDAWGQLTQVFLNPDESDTERRFGLVSVGIPDVNLAWSSDGILWRSEPDPMYPLRSDGSPHVVWVPEHRRWYFYHRPRLLFACGTRDLPEGHRHTQRRYAVCTSDDLRSWSEPRTVLYADERESYDIDALRVFRRHGLFIGLYTVMDQGHGLAEEQTYVTTSRDGFHWERTWDRQPFIDNGPPHAFDHGWASIGGCPPVECGNDLWFYYVGKPVGQFGGDCDPAVGLCRVRKDRFIGHRAGGETGYLLTRQFILAGNRLRINCDAYTGVYRTELTGLRVAVVQAPDVSRPLPQNETGVPGYTLEECDPIRLDHVDQAVTWKGNPDLGPLVGQPVYLRFQMQHATLFGFTVAEE